MRRFSVIGMVILSLIAMPMIVGAKSGDKAGKVTVCHLADNGGAPHEVTISQNALNAHMGHGDLEGPCPPGQDVPPTNSPPTAVISLTNGCSMFGCTVTADGTGSFDPDGDALTYQWSANGVSMGTYTSIVVSGPPGATFTITLTVSDGADSDTATVQYP